MRPLALLALGFFIGGAAGICFSVSAHLGLPDKLVRRLLLAESENERLRALVAEHERSKALEKNKSQREAIERQVETIRGLKFKTPVDYNVLGRAEIKAVVAGKLGEVYSEAEFAAMSAAFARLGLLPDRFPLRETYVELLGEQIAAFYDQHTHKLFMFEDATLDNAQNRIVLAHELTHALADQHFALRTLPLEIKTNDDRAIAASALVEGEATLVMSDFMLRDLSLATLKDSLAGALGQSMEQLQKAPRFLRESLIFPYLQGQVFCAVLRTQGDYEGVSRAFASPPSSTAQVLHPEKYLAQPREEPIAIEWPDVALKGEKPMIDNVVGEFGLRVLFAERNEGNAEKIAEGWRGDRYLHYPRDEALVWKTLWATPEDAEEFRAAEERALAARYGGSREPSVEAYFESQGPRRFRILTTSDGLGVVVLDAIDEERLMALQEQFAR